MKLATVERIHSVGTHPNPEVTSLEVGKIKAWPVVIKKGDFKEGDLVVFITIDSIVPSTNTAFSFMERQKYRIWNARFKGAPSQGLVMSTSLLGPVEVSEGMDVTDLLGVTKYEKPLDLSMNGDAKGGFPTHLVSITDEDNLQSFPEVLNEFHGLEVYLTVKADGSSMTVIYQDGEVRVCSRRLEQKEGTGFWQIADAYKLPEKLKALGQPLAIQAEACGGKIQGNPMGLDEKKMFVFNIKDLSTGQIYGWNGIKKLCEFTLGIPTVNIIHEPFIFDKNVHTISYLQDIANTVTYTSDKGVIKKGEGIVLRPTIPKYSETLGHQLSVKILNQNY